MHALIERLLVEIRESSEARMPSITEICARYDASRVTVSKALQNLEQRGIITRTRGRRARIAGRKPSAAVRLHVSGGDALYRELRDQIARGRWKVGQELPKSAYLTARYHLSPNTVVAVMRRLAAEQYAHRRGKKWIAGTMTIAGARTASHPRVIIILHDTYYRWRNLYKESRTEHFCRTFEHEADSYGIQIEFALTSSAEKLTSFYHEGREALMQRLDALQERCLGVVIAGSRAEIPDLSGWVDCIAQKRKPIVWFDRYGDIPPESRHALNKNLLARCFFDERPALRAALQFLIERGHKNVVYFTACRTEWSRRRARELGHLAETLFPGKLNLSVPSSETQPDETDWKSYTAIAGRIGLNMQRAQRSHRLLCACLSMPISAIIAPNDTWGAFIRSVCLRRGIAGESSISVLSFDNSPESRRIPTSSVDFGFGGLGYKALHYLIGDMPVARDQNGDIATIPFVADRDSVGRQNRG